jgi:two-component system, LytTR family, sensor histidine kinase AlgZ
MHPLLQLRRITLYLLAWIPLCAILLYLLVYLGGLDWQRALALGIPLCFIYAFICLSAWYSCRYTPLENARFSRLVFTHLSAALIVSIVWVLIARGLASALSETEVFSGVNRQMSKIYPILIASGMLLYLLSVALHYVLLSAEASRQAEKREMEARVLARDSELKALKAQVNPHFLFNSLNSISALTSIDPGKAREMCIRLADFLRKTLGLGEKAVIPLREELLLLHSYLAVEQIRYSSRLRFEEQTALDTLDCAVPPLLLQPLVENAVSHGISNLTEGGWIRLDIGRRPSGNLFLKIENNFDPEMPRRRGTGLGLRNVRQRIDARYGSRARFDAQVAGDRFTVTLELPAERVTAASSGEQIAPDGAAAERVAATS